MSRSGTNSLSYTSHARLKVLLLPLRPLKKSRFEQLSDLVRCVTDVRLEDLSITSTSKENNLFDPRRLPAGRVLFDYVSEVDREHSYLEPFEASRQVFAVLLIGDGAERHQIEAVTSQTQKSLASAPSALLLHTLLFDAADFRAQDWPDGTHSVLADNSSSNQPSSILRDALASFTTQLIVKVNELYIRTRERTNLNSPYDPASVLIRPQPQRMSSFALSDAQITPAASPPPGQEKPVRNSLGPGILASADRLKVISNGRAAKLCGDLLLVCGFFNEAMKVFAEAAAIARANNDYLWQGAALEGIGVCIVLHTFLDMSFQVPQIAQVSSSGSMAMTRKAERTSTSSNHGDLDLVDYLPDLHASILGLYQKSTTTQSDQVPAFVLSESCLRVADFLATVHMAGKLDRMALDHLVLGTEIATMGSVVAAYPPRAEIAAWAMRAYQGPVSSLSLSDKVYILSGLASIHGAIGFHRRRALFLREILLSLIPALVQARVAGAAGMGIHPAASLALSESQANNFSKEILLKTQQTGDSLATLLEDIARSYDIPEWDNDADLFRVVLGGYGWAGLRNVVLKDCMSICEAIPDFMGLLKFSARTLQFNAANMERDEQVRLVANIPRITAIAKRSGLQDIEAEYWDSFLVRKIDVHTNISSLPVKRDTRELGDPEASLATGKTSFLYNPYTRKTIELKRPTMVQFEQTDVQVTLQNPFLFDVEALEIALLTDLEEYSSGKASAYIKAGSKTSVTIPFVTRSASAFKIRGCIIRMAGCKPKAFYIRHSPTRTEIESWHVANGGLFRCKKGDKSSQPLATDTEVMPLTVSETLSIDVLPETPQLSFKVPSKIEVLSMTVLEGERSSLQVQLENTSNLMVNFFTCEVTDSTTKPLLQAINSRAKQPHEVYELETFLYKRKAFIFSQKNNPSHIPGYHKENFTLDVCGKRGLHSAQILIEYGHIISTRTPTSAMTEETLGAHEVYTRQLSIPVKCILQQAMDFVHCDILPVSIPSLTPHLSDTATRKFSDLVDVIPSQQMDHFQVLILDVRNAQPQTMTLDLSFKNGEDTFETTVDVLAHSQERILVPLRRAQLSPEHLASSIPSLSQRQFIVSSVSRDVEALERELFWAREDFLSRLEADWRMGSRSGTVETRSINFTKRMVDNYLLPRLQVSLSVDNATSIRLHEQGTIHVQIKSHSALEKERMMLRFAVTDTVTQIVTTQFRIVGSTQVPITIGPALVSEYKADYFPLAEGSFTLQASLAYMTNLDTIIALSPRLDVEVMQ